MTLTRTKSGLQNMHILMGVDLIVYTEGGEGETYTVEEIYAGKGFHKSADIRFWKGMFEHYLPQKKVKLLAVGSCETLNKIAADISEGNLQNVCVAMDKDYSLFWGNYVDHQRVVRTRTYSWENEIFQTDIILEAFKRVAIENFEELETRIFIDDTRNILCGQLKHLLRADLVLVAANKSLFCRQKPESCFEHVKQQEAPPKIDFARMKGHLRRQKADIKGFRLINRPNAVEIDTVRDIFGKPLLIASIRILQHLIRIAKQRSIHKDYLTKFLLEAFHSWIADNPETETAKFYADKFSGVFDAA